MTRIPPQSRTPLQSNKLRLVLFLVVSGLAVYATLGRLDLIDRVPNVADSIGDWLVTRAAFDGLDPYAPVEDLAAIYDVDYISPLTRDAPTHPRLPGALLLQAPMILTDAITASYWVVGLGLGSVLLIAWLLTTRNRSPLVASLAFVVFALWSGVGVWSFVWVTQSALIAAFLYFAIGFHRDRDLPWMAGILLGVMGVLKPHWLALAIPFVLWKRWLTIGITLGTFVILNGIGLVLFGLGVGDVLGTLSQTFDVWFVSGSNVSLASWLNRLVPVERFTVIALQAAALGVWLARAIKFPRYPIAELMGWAVIAVFLSPVAWLHYLMVCLPLVWLFLVTEEIPTIPRVLAGVGTLAFSPTELGFLIPAGMILLLAAVVLSPRTYSRSLVPASAQTISPLK